MHLFTPRWPADFGGYSVPSPWASPLRSADDLIAWAEHDPMSVHRTWPEIWHLDTEGIWQCYSRESSFTNVVDLARDPDDLLECRRMATPKGCPDHWLVLECRQRAFHRRYEVTELDAQAFTTLRASLGRQGVWLLDVVVIGDDGPRWWSLNELTTGTTAWEFPVLPRPRGRTARRRPRSSGGRSGA